MNGRSRAVSRKPCASGQIVPRLHNPLTTCHTLSCRTGKNGSELFGPATGNGFNELAQYDSDHNGWIDESDAVYRQLKVWTKDAAGNDSLNSLASLGVGAISLHAIDTPFDIKTAANQLLGSIKASSVYLNEDGTAGSVQQIDLTA